MDNNAVNLTLNEENSLKILLQYIELAQQKGAYLLSEADLLQRASVVLLENGKDDQINTQSAKQLFIQAVHKGQRHGAYSLNDAALLFKVVTFFDQQAAAPVPAPVQAAAPVPVPASAPAPAQVKEDLDDDLSDLAEPIPLRPKEV